PLEPPLPRPVGAHSERRDRGGLGRVRDMRFAEIAYRGWREASKWLERTVPSELFDQPAEVLRRHARELAEEDVARHVLQTLAPGRFFASGDIPAIRSAVLAYLPAHRDDIVAASDALVPRQFDAPGYATHRHLVRLAQAYALTGHERYAQSCLRAIEVWLDTHPPSSWSSNVEASSRMIAWCWTLLLLRDAKALSGTTLTRLLASLWLHATHVRRHLSYYCSPTPHLTAEAL